MQGPGLVTISLCPWARWFVTSSSLRCLQVMSPSLRVLLTSANSTMQVSAKHAGRIAAELGWLPSCREFHASGLPGETSSSGPACVVASSGRRMLLSSRSLSTLMNCLCTTQPKGTHAGLHWEFFASKALTHSANLRQFMRVAMAERCGGYVGMPAL
eukprot:5128675-Amphidinium_carterae.1